MKRILILSLVSGLLVLAPPALATPRIASLSGKPAAKTPGEIAFTVTIERPTPLDIVRCEVAIEVGDGSPPLHITFNIGDRRVKTIKHTYTKSGTFKAKATGTGSRGCEGTREAAVTVGSVSKAASATPGCPGGWTLVADSVKGNRYTCRANPPAQPLACTGGSKYFSGKGEIGCK